MDQTPATLPNLQARHSKLLSYINERLARLQERLDEAQRIGVHTPGFNATLGAIDELQLLVGHLIEEEG
jgi:hypothetical protein